MDNHLVTVAIRSYHFVSLPMLQCTCLAIFALPAVPQKNRIFNMKQHFVLFTVVHLTGQHDEGGRHHLTLTVIEFFIYLEGKLKC